MSEKTYVLLGILCLIVALLVLAYSTVAGMLAIEGGRLSQLEDETHTIRNQNLQLEDEYLHDTAYTTIESRAREEGFRPAGFIEFGKIDSY